MSNSSLDVQVGGSHYKDLKIQPIEYTMKNGLDFIQGNVIKYITRFKHKDGAKDLKKVIHYAELALEMHYDERPAPTLAFTLSEAERLAMRIVDAALELGEVTIEKLRQQADEADKEVIEYRKKKLNEMPGLSDEIFRTESGHHFQD